MSNRSPDGMKCHRDHRKGDNQVSSGLLSPVGESTIIKSGETTSPVIRCTSSRLRFLCYFSIVIRRIQSSYFVALPRGKQHAARGVHGLEIGSGRGCWHGMPWEPMDIDAGKYGVDTIIPQTYRIAHGYLNRP